jgi:acetamidase/formamidase
MNHATHDRNKAHTIHRHQQHLSWDNARLPAVTVAPGDSVQFKDIDAMCGQITARSTVEDLSTLDLDRVNPIAGPVYVDGAEPGDTLKVTCAEHAYMLCSVCGDLRISEIVDAPNWVVSFYLPRVVFE